MAGLRSSARTGLVWFVGVLAAGFSGMAAFGSVSSARLPLAAVDTIPESGRVYAEAADSLLKQAIRDNQGVLPDAVPQASVDLARRAFALEPLAVEAPRILALAKAADGRTGEARQIMRRIPALSKREPATNVWLSTDYARQGNDAAAFAYFDRTLRVSEGSAPLIIPPLVEGLEREDLRAPLAKLLRASPPWEGDFWIEAVRRPEVALPAMQLRMALGRKEGEALAVDRGLIANLVANRNFGAALTYYRFLTGRPPAQDLTFPFERAPTFPPLDWELLSDGDFSATIDPGAGQLSASVGPDSSGTLARRLLLLPPAVYAVAVDYRTSLADVRLELTFGCADAVAEPVRTKPLEAGSDRPQIVNFPEGCRYRLLEIDYRNDARTEGAEISIDSIRLQKRP